MSAPPRRSETTGFPGPGPVPEAVLELPVTGRGLRGATLGSALAEDGTLLVFLRHFG